MESGAAVPGGNTLFGRCIVYAMARAIGVWIVASVALVAADFWDEKDFTAWSDKEVEEMLTDSPWSQKVTIALSGRAGGRGEGRRGGGGFGGRRPNDGRRRGRGGGGFRRPAGRPRMTVTISWRSALPVKQALVRDRVGINAKVSPDLEQFLVRSEPSYVVSVSGFPRWFAGPHVSDDALLAETILQFKDRDAIVADDVKVYIENDETVSVEYLFPRGDVIAIDDKNVEFTAQLGRIKVKEKFKLKDMVFAGKLAL